MCFLNAHDSLSLSNTPHTSSNPVGSSHWSCTNHSNTFPQRNKQAPHLDDVFLNHLIKRMYEDALNKFVNSPSIHIAFAFYLFKNMKNIHASLVELNNAIKKKPSMQQQFTIFWYRNIIEDFIKQDHREHKYIYPELTNVIEFERLFGEMQRAIERVCNL